MKKYLHSTVALLVFSLIETSTVIPVSAGVMDLKTTTMYHVGDKTSVIDGIYSSDEGWGDPVTTVMLDMTQEEGKYLSLRAASHPEHMSGKDLVWHYSDVMGTAFWGTKSESEEEPVTVSRGFASLDEATAAIGKTPVTAYEFVDGSNGFAGEGAENLWDNATTTKFCTNETPIHSVVKLNGMYSIDGVIMATANDNDKYNGRSPYDWTIQGSTDGENWTTIKNGDYTFFEEVNFTYFAEAVDPSPEYCYIRFVAEGAISEVFQISEVVVTGTRTGDLPSEEPTEEIAPTADEKLDEKAEAPNTFDFSIVAAATAVISACGFAAAKKKHR